MQKIYPHVRTFLYGEEESQFLLDEIGLEVSRSQKSNRKSGGETKKVKIPDVYQAFVEALQNPHLTCPQNRNLLFSHKCFGGCLGGKWSGVGGGSRSSESSHPHDSPFLLFPLLLVSQSPRPSIRILLQTQTHSNCKG